MIKILNDFFKGKLNVVVFYKSPALSLLSKLKRTKKGALF